MNFVECYLEGAVKPNDIGWYVEAWHAGLGGAGMQLHEYLGFSWEEYVLWSTTPSALQSILNARTGTVDA
ncbi:hypothetical protein [Pseudomonas sp. CFBP 8772]|uniref:hypothetical protein n=1 Tax=Pseudomonas sp. CFBP 8772 TaxID=2775284 RepID=UPI00177C5FB8|nr:hypothetical protein [Pseudomonas sp. CFBP 8772]MBD8597047.1 hypothetical protein [Pseudomonas sp. CFBP 8772]